MYPRSLLRQLQTSSIANITARRPSSSATSTLSPIGNVVLFKSSSTFRTIQERTFSTFPNNKGFFTRPGKIHSILQNKVCVATAVTSTMANATPDQPNMNSHHDTLSGSVTVIRYKPGNERFQMQVTLLTGKTFNFERKCSDSVSNVMTRMVASIEKKVKNFNGTVKFLPSAGSTLVDSEAETETMEFDKILRNYFNSTSSSLQVQVGENIYDVVFNPPEIYTVKFFGTFMPTFPLFPYKMETSDNFSKDKSLFKWEFSREKPSPIIPPKLRKKSKDGSIQSRSSTEWKECGSGFIFTPEKGMEGGYLRFSCTPSNGITLGKPFSITLPNPIASLPVDLFLYQERLSRLPPKEENGDCLRVLCYNVLADTYATPEWFISSPKECLDVGYRLPILNKELQLYQADLICLQEVDEKYYEGNFEPFLGVEGYRGMHTSKIGNTKEGIATFHNPAKLTLLESFECVILEHMKKLPLWERLLAVGDEFTQRLEERNTVFHVSVFQVNNCPKKTILLVGNVHLYFHPDADHIRLLQTITCIDFLESKLACVKETYKDQRVSVIYCGDLNCTPPFSSYRLLTSGQVDENDEDWTSHPTEKISPGILINHTLNLTNSHPNHELTNITTCFEGCLDYILYQTDCFKLISTYSPPSKEELAVLTKVEEIRKVSLPNMYTPSDHLPIIADLQIKP